MAREQRVTPTGLRRETDPPLLVLMSLASGDKHGQALAADIAEVFGVRLGPGTLYGAITRLEVEGLIEPLAPEGRRRPYRITEVGTSSLEENLAELERMVAVGSARVRARKPARNLRFESG